MGDFNILTRELVERLEEFEGILSRFSPPSSLDPLERLPSPIQTKRLALVNMLSVALRFLNGGEREGWDIACNWTKALALRLVCHYRISSLVPISGSSTYDAIAYDIGIPKESLSRILRLAMAFQIFAKTEDGKVRHTAISHALATNPGHCSAVEVFLAHCAPAAPGIIDVWDTYGPQASEPAQSAFSLYHNTDKSYFDLINEQPQLRGPFDTAMDYWTRGAGPDFLRSYPWASLDANDAHLVDVGGGKGHLARLLAQVMPLTTFTVQDLPSVVAKVEESGTAGRVRFEEHDFFRPQRHLEEWGERPPTLFLISQCLHDWSDKYAVMILKGLVPALRTGSRVFLHEYVLNNEPSQEQWGYQLDFALAVLTNGKSRSLDELQDLLQQSDVRYKIEKEHRAEGASLSVVEISWEG